MARYSAKKPGYLATLAAAFQPVRVVAEMGSNADKALLAHAERALHFAGMWTRDTTEASRRRMAEATALLQHDAESAPFTGAVAGFRCMVRAFEAFGASNYSEMQRYAEAASRVRPA